MKARGAVFSHGSEKSQSDAKLKQQRAAGCGQFGLGVHEMLGKVVKLFGLPLVRGGTEGAGRFDGQ